MFAVADSRVERALTSRLPLWKPGGNVQQFAALFGPLRITPLDVVGAQVTYESKGVDKARDAALNQPANGNLTEEFRRGVAALQDLLVRDEPETAEAFTGWAWLAALDVRLLPGLMIRLDPGGTHAPIELPVEAQIDRGRNTLFLNSNAALTTKSGAGMAIAAHFTEERSRMGHSWRDVWEEHLVEAKSGAALTSSGQRSREERQRLDEELRRRAQRASVPPMPNGKQPTQRGAGDRPGRRRPATPQGFGRRAFARTPRVGRPVRPTPRAGRTPSGGRVRLRSPARQHYPHRSAVHTGQRPCPYVRADESLAPPARGPTPPAQARRGPASQPGLTAWLRGP